MFSDTEVIPLERAKGLLLVLNTAKGMWFVPAPDKLLSRLLRKT